jgi:hypothetical protein
MARYTRMEIEALCKRVEDTANKRKFYVTYPQHAADLKTMVMLLRLTIQLADIQEIEEIGPSNVVHLHKH